ncbi:MAG: aminoglycoside phosphotransferase family protein, partial [Chitinophagales bacterium]
MQTTNLQKGTPPPEINITLELVQNLLISQHPDLSHLPIIHLDSGWDNTLFRLGTDYILRIPRRQVAEKLLRVEQKWLPILSKRLPIEVPTPIRIGRPNKSYPWHWSITPFFEGKAAALQYPNDSEAITLAHFLKALHQPAPKDAPVNLLRGVPLLIRAENTNVRLQRLKEKTGCITPKIEAIWEAALAAKPYSENRWIHGDLHPRNIVVHNSKIRAVIDWGDMTSGDVANDLACIWMLFKNPQARQKAIEVYQPSPDLVARAKGWAVFFGAVLL